MKNRYKIKEDREIGQYRWEGISVGRGFRCKVSNG